MTETPHPGHLPFEGRGRRREVYLITLVASIGLVVLPCLNAFVPADNFWHVSNFTINLYGKYLCYAVLALGVNLLWGYTGILSLGQALFFTLGGYALGMHLMLMIGKLGQYKSDLPDFMVFLGHTFLPWFWKPFSSFSFAFLMVLLVPGLLALVFG